LLPAEQGPFYIPALAATEFMVGIHPPVRADLRQRATQLYNEEFRLMVSAFSEADAAEFAALIAELKAKGQPMKFFDAGIARQGVWNFTAAELHNHFQTVTLPVRREARRRSRGN
jgi:hypothetical protein